MSVSARTPSSNIVASTSPASSASSTTAFTRAGAFKLDNQSRMVTSEGIPLEPAISIPSGAEDITDLGDTWQVTTAPGDLHAVRTALEGGGFAIVNADLTMLPSNTIALEDESRAKQVLRVIDALEEHDDVQNVYANFDIPDAVLQSVMA